MILFSLFSIKYYFVSCFSMKNMVTHGVCFHVDMLNLNNINFFVLMTVIGDQHFPYQYESLNDPWSLYTYISTSINHFGSTPSHSKKVLLCYSIQRTRSNQLCKVIKYFITDILCRFLCQAFQTPEVNLIIASYFYLNIDKR